MCSLDRIHIFRDHNDLSRALASRISGLEEHAFKARAQFNIAISGGSLLDTFTPYLITEPLRSTLNWSSWEVFWADERCVPLSSPESNFAAADRLLFKYVKIPGHKIHAPETALGPEKAARSYQETIKNVLQPETGQLPRFDLILLGMGQDGHTASLFPGHEILQEKQQWVVPVFAAPKPPLERITLTLPVINQAREVIFVVTGAEKASALRAVFDNQGHGQRLPAALVNPRSGHLKWFVDQAAAEQLVLEAS